MPLIQELRRTYHDLWEKTVMHPCGQALGNGTLPAEKFRRYFLQDYLFVNDLVSLVALGIARAPDFGAANHLHQFLSGILHPENDLFVRAFNAFGVSEAAYTSVSASPTTQAFGDFLMRVGLSGDFEEILTVLYVTEAVYLDWGSRLLDSGRRPDQPLYREWIELHGPQVLGGFVGWIEQHLNHADPGPRRARIDRLFLTALRYEYLFWDAAYHGDTWPDQA